MALPSLVRPLLALLVALLLGPSLAQDAAGCGDDSCGVRASARDRDPEVEEHSVLQTHAVAGHGRNESVPSSMEVAAGRASSALLRSGSAADRSLVGHCLHYSVTFPAASTSGVRLSEVQVRYTVVDTATVAPPSIRGSNGGKREIPEDYNGYKTPRRGNSIYDGFGRDMFTIYYIEDTSGHEAFYGQGDSHFTVEGLWPNSAFISVEVSYGAGDRVAYDGPTLTATFEDGSPAPNPFVLGNPTVLAYPSQASCAAQLTSLQIAEARRSSRGSGKVQQQKQQQVDAPASLVGETLAPGCMPTNTNVYRVAESFSNVIGTEGGTAGDCPTTLLYSPAKPVGYAFSLPTLSFKPVLCSYWFTYGYIKMRVPRTFNNFQDLVFKDLKSPGNLGGYDALAFTISSNWLIPPSPNVPFGISSLMLLEQGFNAHGVAFVLFAPRFQVQSLSKPWDTLPPTVYLPHLNVKAYVLAAPDYAFLFRYRSPSSFWKGSPGNVECRANLTDSLEVPATCGQLGDFLPQVTRLNHVQSIQQLIGRVA